MGTNSSRQTNSKPSDILQNQHYYDEIVQYDECCGFQRRRVVKKGLIWEDNFNRNCQDLSMYYQWVHDVQQVVKLQGRKLPRKKFIDEFNALKILNKGDVLRQDQILLSPSQIDQFKVNLKNSVLLSYGQALKPPKPKQNARLQSSMSVTRSFQKNINQNMTRGNSPIQTPNKRGDYFDQRKQSILRQRDRALRQTFTKTGFRQSILSFVDDTMSTMLRGHQKQISKQSAHGLQIFIKFSLILQKHFTHNEHIIFYIVENFTNYIYKKYTIFNNSEESKKQIQSSIKQKQVLCLDQIQQNWKNKAKKQRFKQLQDRKNLTTQQIQQLTTDIKMFLILLRQIVQDYYKTFQFTYNINESYIQNQDLNYTQMSNINSLISNQDNILILVTSVLFKSQKFYNHIMNVFKKYHEERQKKFNKILESLKDKSPQYFQIKKQYCLNSTTMQKYDKLQFPTQQNNSNYNQIQKKSNKEIKSTSNNIQKTDSTTITKPFVKCAQTLQKITKSRTPTAKMKVIMQCSQKITDSIAQFYNSNNIQLKNQVLDADQILSIFCYILSLNPVQNIHSNLFMIQNFATQNQMISVTGYYYSVLTIAIQQLQNMYSSTVADLLSIQKSSSINSKMSAASLPKQKNLRSKSNMSKVAKQKLKRSFKVPD